MNLEGIKHVMSLEEEVVRLRDEVEQLRHALTEAVNNGGRRRADLVPLRQAVTLFGHRPSIFDPNK
jgi:MerR family transcriptional regulator/heat shock protein HspR